MSSLAKTKHLKYKGSTFKYCECCEKRSVHEAEIKFEYSSIIYSTKKKGRWKILDYMPVSETVRKHIYVDMPRGCVQCKIDEYIRCYGYYYAEHPRLLKPRHSYFVNCKAITSLSPLCQSSPSIPSRSDMFQNDGSDSSTYEDLPPGKFSTEEALRLLNLPERVYDEVTKNKEDKKLMWTCIYYYDNHTVDNNASREAMLRHQNEMSSHKDDYSIEVNLMSCGYRRKRNGRKFTCQRSTKTRKKKSVRRKKNSMKDADNPRNFNIKRAQLYHS
eukprot:TRINITY_DN9582_c0_g1_i1.p1 TRINITY_DN9582_c0_g1~~TRINITY_DN9582_c0_g1_i1.p1  ORF type:complete len:273 (-),score=23.00 TRINITY_DN9582_c0_g1_i1:40-858(-)